MSERERQVRAALEGWDAWTGREDAGAVVIAFPLVGCNLRLTLDIASALCHALPMTTTRDYAAEYKAACIADRAIGATLAQRDRAEARMDDIAEAAADAGVALDVFGIDESVRVSIYGE